MPEQTPTIGMERKLAAIFSTDVVGYSLLMGDDEEATIRVAEGGAPMTIAPFAAVQGGW